MAKSSRKGKSSITTMPAAEAKHLTSTKPFEISDRDIARRAFEIYCERGGQHGHDLEDWFQAERELWGATMVGAA